MSKEFEKKFNEKEKSIISETFYSQLLTSYICECQNITYSFQKIGDIPLLLPDNINEVSLNELLSNYFSGEMVEFQYKCKNCNKIVQHLKYIRFAILPKILILSLQRIDILDPVFGIIPRRYSELSHRYSDSSQKVFGIIPQVFRIIPKGIPIHPRRYFELSRTGIWNYPKILLKNL